jgi:hypothetical protein
MYTIQLFFFFKFEFELLFLQFFLWKLITRSHAWHPHCMRLTTPRIHSYAYPFDNSAGSKVLIMRADASGSASIAGATWRLVVNGQTAHATPVAARNTALIANYDL